MRSGGNTRIPYSARASILHRRTRAFFFARDVFVSTMGRTLGLTMPALVNVILTTSDPAAVLSHAGVPDEVNDSFIGLPPQDSVPLPHLFRTYCLFPLISAC